MFKNDITSQREYISSVGKMADINKKEVSLGFANLLEFGFKIINYSGIKVNGVHGAQFRLLTCLNEIPMEKMTTLGKELYISKQSMTNLVDSLIREGYVERQFNPDDRRIIYVKITEDGRKHLLELREQLNECFEEKLEELEPSDLELMAISIQNLVNIGKKYL